jgi:kynurenine 3-monooxygenase
MSVPGDAAPLCIVGGGPVGVLLAVLLAHRGRRVRIYERRSDPRSAAPERGRSINLALAARGLGALKIAGVLPVIEPELVSMPGRMLHDEHGATRFIAYGQRPDEVIWSVSRAALNRALIMAAAQLPGIELHFNQRCMGADPASGTLQLRNEVDGSTQQVIAAAIIGADGAGSALRAAMVDANLCQSSEAALDHDYRELHIPAGAAGTYRLEPHALHIWPRGGFMLIALPNTDGSFTATLFLPRQGAISFAALQSDASANASSVNDFFHAQFVDVPALIPDLDQQFLDHPQGQLATLHCWPWQAHRTLLLGDAAHAIVPFHGQGLNCGFEDCVLLDTLLAKHADAASAFAAFERERRPNTDAIAIMAIENYQEMRDAVRSPDFERRKHLALELERLYPARFIPRYSMVMFHPEIGYADALQRGITQERLLDALLAQGVTAGSDAARALLAEAGL